MSRFNASYKGIGEMLAAPWMVAEMERRAKQVKARAEQIAPDAPPYGEGYKYSFEVDSGVKESKKGTRRAFGRVRNTSPHAIYVEFQKVKGGPAHRPLGKALDAAKE